MSRDPGNGGPPHRAPVILVVSPDERSAEVTIQGHTRVVTGNSPKETRNAALDLAAGYAAHLGTSVLINARDANGAWQLIISPTGVVRAAGGTEIEIAAKRAPGRGRRGRRVVMVTAGGALAIAAVAGIGVAAVPLLPGLGPSIQVGPGEDPAVTLEGRSAPPGFTTRADWRLPTLPGTRPGVAPDGSAVAFIDPDEQVTVVNPEGTTLWSAGLPLPPGDIEGAPTFITDGQGDLGLAVTGNGRLWQWPAGGGEPTELELPSGSRVTFAGTSPLVLGEGTAQVPDDGELRTVAIPSGYGAILAEPGRVLTAVQDGPWRWVGLDGDTTEVEPQAPDGAGDIAEVLTGRSDHMIVRWSAEEGDQEILAVHDSGDGSVVAQTPVDPALLDGARWLANGSVAAYGPVIVDLDGGSATVLEGFAPGSAAGGFVYGEAAGAPVAVGPDADPVNLPADVVRPWGVLDGRAVIIADGDLYALSPE
ncbi:hypothetical protein ACFOVU_17945 [Nocardiopsis sediminis]|uniref:WD40 repeat domain-containing protein n=1 Tax=Nocardiopsis sediminis TaxID=1778267 RepID=A0ABV8FNZ3_9ACTN